MSILQTPMVVLLSPTSCAATNLSSIKFLVNQDFSNLSITKPNNNNNYKPNLTITMGGGPRTFPGGVSKWQWKRMQANKSKQLLKARLSRERQIYEMRKRAELQAAVSELEKPWEVVERAPTLFSVRADEQLKTLADRFQRPGGYDLWSERDGPQLFRPLPSAKFFPNGGVVHSVKPYQSVTKPPGGRDDDGSGFRRNGHFIKSSGNGIGELEGGNENLVSKRDNLGTSFSEDIGFSSDSEVDMDALGNVDRRNMQNVGSGRTFRLDSEQGTFHRQRRSRHASDERMVHRERLSNKDSGKAVRGRHAMGGSNGTLRNKGKRENVGQRNSYGLDSGQHTFDTEGKDYIFRDRRVRYGSEERGANREESGNVDRRQMHGNNYKGRAEMGASRGALRQKGNREDFGSANMNGVDEGQNKFDRGGRGEVSRDRRGRYGSNAPRRDTVRVSRKPKVSHTGEVYNMSLKQDGRHEL